jgi:hypothetical protein
MQREEYKQPVAEGAEVAQKTQKIPEKESPKLNLSTASFVEALRPWRLFSGIFLRLLRNFCAFCVRYFSLSLNVSRSAS